jgi:hypothetical protein
MKSYNLKLNNLKHKEAFGHFNNIIKSDYFGNYETFTLESIGAIISLNNGYKNGCTLKEMASKYHLDDMINMLSTRISDIDLITFPPTTDIMRIWKINKGRAEDLELHLNFALHKNEDKKFDFEIATDNYVPKGYSKQYSRWFDEIQTELEKIGVLYKLCGIGFKRSM